MMACLKQEGEVFVCRWDGGGVMKKDFLPEEVIISMMLTVLTLVVLYLINQIHA